MATGSENAAAIVLAAGRGRRMRSRLPKVLHVAGGLPLLGHVLGAVNGLGLAGGCTVVASAEVKAAVEGSDWGRGARCVQQETPRGTADAVRVALDAGGMAHGTLLVAQGGTPLIRTDTLRALLETHRNRGASATLLTALAPDPYGYGRVVRNVAGEIERIVEERDATEAQRSIQEVNAGAYVFEADRLAHVLTQVGSDNDQGEYYLPDVIALVRSEGDVVASHHTTGTEIMGVKSQLHLSDVAAALRRRTAERWMAAGVTIVDPATTYIDASASLEAEAVVHPFTFIEGASRVAAGARLGPNARVVDSEIGRGAHVSFSVVVGSRVGPEASVGPFASLRPGTTLERAAKVGTFVETKNTSLGEDSKANHLSYLGDATVGSGVNIGAGTITCNWDGRDKHETVIEDDAYVGSDTMLVAPARLGRRAATGAGAVVRGDVPDDALAVGVPARVIRGRGDKMRRADGGGTSESAPGGHAV